MGLLQDGIWLDQWYDTKASKGNFIRQDAAFRNWLTKDGTPGPSGKGGFKAEAGRYHLYVSYACPWAHRTLIFRALKGLDGLIGLSAVEAHMGAEGWTFERPEPINGVRCLHQLYSISDPHYSGRVTVPVLWDKQTKTIVSNESSEIIRMFNSAFDDIGAVPGDYYPEALRAEIDQVNARIYDTINNGVYKAGFATSQDAYDQAVATLFDSLAWLEQRLSTQRYLCGAQITEADWRFFTTLVRFDPVYVGHFKCNLKRIADYANLSGYVRDLYQYPNIQATVNLCDIKTHYYTSHPTINPTGIVPLGPQLDYAAAHDRDRF